MAALFLVLWDVALPIFSSLSSLSASVFYLYRASVLSAGRRNIVVVLGESGGCYLYLIERECMCASYRPFRLPLPLLQLQWHWGRFKALLICRAAVNTCRTQNITWYQIHKQLAEIYERYPTGVPSTLLYTTRHPSTHYSSAVSTVMGQPTTSASVSFPYAQLILYVAVKEEPLIPGVPAKTVCHATVADNKPSLRPIKGGE